MVADFDIIDFLHVLTSRSVELLDVSAAGLLLADPRGELRVVAASSEAARLLELFQLQSDEGPAWTASGPASRWQCTDLSADQRWPRFAEQAGQAGFCRRAGPADAAARPGHRRAQPLPRHRRRLRRRGVHVGQALADVATISLLHDRSMRRTDTLNEQLQTALNSRVIIEQAKGKLAERLGIDVSQAFTLLRDQARNRNQRLSDLARAFVDGTQAISAPSGSPRTSRPGRIRQP